MTLHITAAIMNDYEYLVATDIHLSNTSKKDPAAWPGPYFHTKGQ
ncbi:hypothetical protein [Paenibacillus wulumuqiensis]|nr:hypothetical protein [Paenibacillus wulumuqiensis]